jgi:hypothetical protein
MLHSGVISNISADLVVKSQQPSKKKYDFFVSLHPKKKVNSRVDRSSTTYLRFNIVEKYYNNYKITTMRKRSSLVPFLKIISIQYI